MLARALDGPWKAEFIKQCTAQAEEASARAKAERIAAREARRALK